MMSRDQLPVAYQRGESAFEEDEPFASQMRMDTRASTRPIAVALFGLALLCALLAGFVMFDLGGILVDQPPVNGSVDSPGIGYAGIVGAQEAEVREEYDSRSFGERLAAASSNASRAAVIKEETNRIAARLEILETRKAELQEIDDDNRAQVTSFVAQSRVLEQRLDRVQQAAETLPPALREEYGLTEQTFRTLRTQTEALTTPEMRALARDVAGDDVGDDLDDDDDDPDDDRDDDQDEDDDDQDEDDEDLRD